MFDLTSCHLTLQNANLGKNTHHLGRNASKVRGERWKDLTLVEVGRWRVGIPTESWRQQADFGRGVGIWTKTDALLNILKKRNNLHFHSVSISQCDVVMMITCSICCQISVFVQFASLLRKGKISAVPLQGWGYRQRRRSENVCR